jgi:hypothetical protein
LSTCSVLTTRHCNLAFRDSEQGVDGVHESGCSRRRLGRGSGLGRCLSAGRPHRCRSRFVGFPVCVKLIGTSNKRSTKLLWDSSRRRQVIRTTEFASRSLCK